MEEIGNRWPFSNLAFIATSLGEEHKKSLYSTASELFNMGICMTSREKVHDRINGFVDEIGKEADLSGTLKSDLWQALRYVAIDGLDRTQDNVGTYEDRVNVREYLEKMIAHSNMHWDSV